MKILLDTNILIFRESHNTKNRSVADVFKWIDKLNYKKCIHPVSIEEINKYKDNDLKESFLLKLNSYEQLVIGPYVEQEEPFFKVVNGKKYGQDQNSQNDNKILLQLYRKTVDAIISEDLGIHRKAQELNLSHKVFTINSFIVMCAEDNPDLLDYKALSIRKSKFGLININDSFFDSLRENYGVKEFNNWFRSKNDNDVYVLNDKSNLLGFLFLKIEKDDEDYSNIRPHFLKKKRLKIGTLKIDSTGYRLGERFLKIIFDNALENNVDEIYVTLFKEKDEIKGLYNLFIKWGFIEFGKKDSNAGVETVLIKDMLQYNKMLSPRENFPLLSDSNNYYILPIEPKYHTDLFPDSMLKKEEKIEFKNKAHRFAIQKSYISGAYNVDARPGDIILIYRNGEYWPKKYSSTITSIAIVQEIVQANSIDQMLMHCENRSVFSNEEIKKFYPKYSLVVKLLFYKVLNKKVMLNQLWKLDIISAPNGPRPFTKISKNNFEMILKESA